jgi:hypothetical protein
VRTTVRPVRDAARDCGGGLRGDIAGVLRSVGCSCKTKGMCPRKRGANHAAAGDLARIADAVRVDVAVFIHTRLLRRHGALRFQVRADAFEYTGRSDLQRVPGPPARVEEKTNARGGSTSGSFENPIREGSLRPRRPWTRRTRMRAQPRAQAEGRPPRDGAARRRRARSRRDATMLRRWRGCRYRWLAKVQAERGRRKHGESRSRARPAR